MKISVHQVIGTDCVTLEDGRWLYKQFIPELQAGREVELDFRGVEVVAASFLNASLGYLLRDFTPGELHRLVKVSHLSPWSRKVLMRVIENCRRFYQEEPGQVAPPHLLAGEANPCSESSCG